MYIAMQEVMMGVVAVQVMIIHAPGEVFLQEAGLLSSNLIVRQNNDCLL